MGDIRLDIDKGIDRQDLSRLRERFLNVNHDRLQRANLVLTQHQQSVLRLLPLLLHINDPQLPGYISDSTPAGFSAYQPSVDLIKEAQVFVPSFVYKTVRGAQAAHSLYALFLMGSLGSVAYAEDSDMDFWLCHSADLTPIELQELRDKCDVLQEWAAGLGAKIYFFLIEPEQFSRGQTPDGQLTLDDCGATQHYLLLDEFYRTALWLAGRTPLWWFVPVAEEHRYQEYGAMLLAKQLLRNDEVIDFGCLAQIPASEFIGAGMWQLYKGIESPYKSLLKLLLIEVYATEHPQVQCLSLSYKRAIYADQLNLDELDSYVMLYRRLETYLLKRNELERLELVRRCFYLKVGKRLTQSRLRRSTSWRRRLLEQLTHEWEWRAVLLSHLDRRQHWKVLQAEKERSLLVNELVYSYRLLTQLAQHMQAEQAVNSRDLTILWRRLYAAFERKAGKVEYLNPGIAPDLLEQSLTLVQCKHDEPEQTSWGVFRGSVVGHEWHNHSPLRRTKNLLPMLAWAYLNGVIDDSTELRLVTTDSALSEFELHSILTSLRRVIPLPLPAVAEETLLLSSYPVSILLLVNIGLEPLPQHSQAHVSGSSEQVPAYGSLGLAENLVLSIDQVVLNSWNELIVSRVSGDNAVLQCLAGLLNDCPAHATDVQIHVACFAGNQADLIVARVEQLVAQAFANTQQGDENRYLLQIGQQLHILQWSAGRAGFRSFIDLAAFTEYLSQEQDEYIRWRVDEYALRGHVLKFILPVGRADTVQIFYRVDGAQAHLYVLDERNGLWQQTQPFVDQQRLLAPLQRFLSALFHRHSMTEFCLQANAAALAPLSVKYYRIYPDGHANPQRIEPCHLVSSHREHTFYPVQAIYEADGGLTLYCNHQEFSELQHGAQLYHCVARYILDMRGTDDAYPCYITDIDVSNLGTQGHRQTLHFLQRKALLEKRLNKALQAF
ncbi:class I adenylate cyclase [Denitrificimonas caeni]|uniref:class I adenylate cyclase n=1 Tax=Denitrificimonas caeni TaxID=521720 RepID=UPI0019636388|nr:class I adenylate cyclase [Denitrificimonas caeni]